MKSAVALAMAILLRHPDRLEAARRASDAHGVACEVILAVGVVEQGLGGLDTPDGPARAWPHPGDVTAQADAAAHAIARWRPRCGGPLGALQFYHRASCEVAPCPRRSRHRHGRTPYALLVDRLARRLAAAGVTCR